MALNLTANFLAPLGVALVVAGGAALVTWGAVGQKVDAHETRIHELERSNEKAAEDRTQVVSRLTAVETKIDILLHHFDLDPPGARP